jgi:hypothetical protein
MSASGNEDFCAPTQLDGFVNAVTTFLTTDPSRDNTKIAAASAIAVALRRAFPCKPAGERELLPQGLPNGQFPLEIQVDLSKPTPAGHTLCFCLRERPSGKVVVVNYCRLNAEKEPPWP